ncbi:HPP family protein [Sphingomonas sp. PB4P5]|uniref:HPP family protein n=1 Tax=Parasphingomonas puruogangriensis TaxID=3096155 RepID=UPI002FC81EE9
MKSLFLPILAGATLRDRIIACAAASIGIGLTAWLSALVVDARTAALLVAPMGASAVLIFAVPTSPLAQPWPVIGGNVLSALVGIAIARAVPNATLAAGLAVAGAILVMSLTRSLHPPGGAAALLPVLGGSSIVSMGYWFAVVPVGLNAAVLAALGLLLHRLTGHSYPHRAAPAGGQTLPSVEMVPHPEDLDLALADLGETFDVSREDLDLLFERVEQHAVERKSRAR